MAPGPRRWPVVGLALLLALANQAAAAPSRACSAPPLPPPSGTIVAVSTEAQLQAAVQSLASGTTILIQPGTYVLTSTLWIKRDVQDVAIRGSTNSCDDVVLVGRGMANASYGDVPHGLFISDGRRILIANLTIKDVYYHPIQLDPRPGVRAARIYNVRLVDAGEQFIKAAFSADGVVEYSIMEYTTTARSWYTNGVDVHRGANWIIRHNLFRNIRAPAGRPAGPAILMWNGSRDTIVEGNLFLNCQVGIALGLDPNRSDDHRGGIVRNNFVHRGAAQSGGTGITINNSAGTKVLHNTVVLSGTHPDAIEYRFSGTARVEIRFNLADGTVRRRDGASGVVSDNVAAARPSWFVDAAAGDLHLNPTAVAAIDRAAPHPDVPRDYDGEARPAGAAPDIGAHELAPSADRPPRR